MDRAWEARKIVGGALARLRMVRREMDRHPAFFRWEAEGALHLPELGPLLRAAGIDRRLVEPSILVAEDAALYALAAIDSAAWDAASVEIDRAIESLAKIQSTLGGRRRQSWPRFRRGWAVGLIRGLLELSMRNFDGTRFDAWRRLDVAVAHLETARRRQNVELVIASIRTLSYPQRLRPHLLRTVAGAHRETKGEVRRLLAEGQEAADYAVAGFEQGVLSAARIDLDRLDASLRALRHIVQRESVAYLPEPWLLRGVARVVMAKRMRREAAIEARESSKEFEAAFNKARAKSERLDPGAT